MNLVAEELYEGGARVNLNLIISFRRGLDCLLDLVFTFVLSITREITTLTFLFSLESD